MALRISTSTLFDVNVATLNLQQRNLLHTQQQIATGRRILTPADDPAAAARALQITQADGTNTQYLANIGTAQDTVGLAESTMQGIKTVIQNVQSIAVQAGNRTLSDTDRKSLANDLQNNLDQLLSMANARDSVGNYLFSGFKGSTQPFIKTPTGVQYQGDDGQRLLQVSSNRQIAASDSGADLFMRIKNGNGNFTTMPAPTNTGSGVISIGSLTTPPPTAAQSGNSYQITFSVAAGGATTYSITGTDPSGAALPTAAQPGALPTAVPFTSGQPITLNGIQFNIQGAPANGDKFTVSPSVNESVFTTMSNLINTLNTPTIPGNPASSAMLATGVDRGLNGLDNALNSVLTSLSSQGSRLKELDSLKTTESNLGVQLKTTLSMLQDVDYNKAITDLTQQQTMLQASQKSFIQIQNLSMFNYLP